MNKTLKEFLSCVQVFLILWTVALQAPLSMGCSRQEYWSGLPFPSPGDLPHPRIKPRSPGWQAGSLPAELPGKPHLYAGIYKLELVSSTEVRERYFWEES